MSHYIRTTLMRRHGQVWLPIRRLVRFRKGTLHHGRGWWHRPDGRRCGTLAEIAISPLPT
jgi:hypothetical protein